MKIVIIGNGVAGMEAALTVRNREPSWDITIVSEESDHFFSRTALMWVFTGQMSHRDIEPLERDAYERLNIKRVRARVTGLQTDAHQMALSNGEFLSYDRLLIACGSAPRGGPWPGSDLRGVGHFVTLQDLDWYIREVHGAPHDAAIPPRPDAHVPAASRAGLNAGDVVSPYAFREVAAEKRGSHASQPSVIGGGLIGIEAIEVAVAAGLRPKFFIREDWFWPIALDPQESKWISERMAEHGVDVLLDHEIETLNADDAGNVRSITTDQGDYDTDCVVVAIGVMANTAWLTDAGLELDRGGGVVVDAGLKTGAPDVFAAGDCASVRWFDGSQRPEQLWYTARDQGRLAGQALLGDSPRYERGIWYNSAKLMDIEYTTVGLVNWNVEREQNWYHEETGRVRSTTRIVTQDGRVVGFNLLGRRWDHTVLLGWLRERRTLDWVLRHLRDASFDTEFVPPLQLNATGDGQMNGAAPSFIRTGTTTVPF